MATGATLALAPKRLLEPSAPLRRLLLDTSIGDLFDRSYAIDRKVYRVHRIVGALVVVGAAASLALLVFLSIDPRSAPVRQFLGRLGFRTTVAVAATLAVILVVFGLCMLIRPSVLKGIEAAANRWIVPTRPAKRFDLSRLVLAAPRLVGVLLFVAGFACLWRI